MRKLFILLSVVLSILGIVFTVLPTEKLGLIPVFLAIFLAILALKKSSNDNKKVPQLLLGFTILIMIVAIAKIILTKDEVVVDQKDEQIKIESQKQDQKDLEALDELE